MVNNDYTVLGGFLLLFGLLLFIGGFYWFKRKRLMENIPTSKIRALAMGLVEIYGDVVSAGTLLTSPLTKKSCVYYHYMVQKYKKPTKKQSGRWVTVQTEIKSIQFYLQDDTGKVLVDPTKASIEISADNQKTDGDTRYVECLIEPNNQLYIMGTAGENPVKNIASADHMDNIMIQQGTNEKFYYISDKSEKQILKSLSLRPYGMWGFGIVLIVVGIILFFHLL